MTRKVMLINATDPEEIRVATLVDSVMSDFDIEFVHNEKIKGNIYKAKVVRVDNSLQAAFIHYGGQKNGFLPIGELPRDLTSPDGRRGRIQDLLSRDQEIMVQAVREELGSKGAMMTAQISLPGRYLVLTPGNPMNGISRKIESREEREYFKRLIDELEIPKNMGVIVRTASLGVTKEDFQRDLEYLTDTYKEVLSRYKHRQGPGLVWQEDDVVTRTLRDCFSSDMEEVFVDELDTFHQAQSFFRRTMPQYVNVLKHYIGKKPLFSKFQTEEQIDRIYARKVLLPSGGALVIDQTEALVAIDVNSGKTSGEGVEDMAFKTNMEAAEEAARQLRLRDLAGLVVIDFIDMKREGNNRSVQDRLVECLKEDKARMEVGKINRFGVLVMTRQRIRPSIQHVTHEACPMCQGSGKVKNLESLTLSVVRRIKAILCREAIKVVRVKLAPVIALSVLNQKRKDLAALEELHDAQIVILADVETGYGEMATEIERKEEEVAEKPLARPMEHHRELDDETVVLGGDAPISFEKALAPDPRKIQPPAEVGIKYDHRDAQRAALGERERLRALFESALPQEDEASETEILPLNMVEVPVAVKPEADHEPSFRRGRIATSESPVIAVSTSQETAFESEPEWPLSSNTVSDEDLAPERPVLTADILADLAIPAPRPRLLSGGTTSTPPANEPAANEPAAAPAVEAKPKRGRKPKAAVEVKPEAVLETVRVARPVGRPRSRKVEPVPEVVEAAALSPKPRKRTVRPRP